MQRRKAEGFYWREAEGQRSRGRRFYCREAERQRNREEI
jgi:hypothetical protein